jgi:hypothetical protein
LEAEWFGNLRRGRTMLRKESRYECLFCVFFNGCGRLKVNDRIIKIVQEEGKCPDRKPIWINPSCRNSIFYFTDKRLYMVGLDDPIEPSKYYRIPSKEVKEYVEKS